MTCSPSVPFERVNRRSFAPLLIVLTAVLLWSVFRLELSMPSAFHFAKFVEFFSYSLRPALTYQAAEIPDGTPPLLLRLLAAAGTTVLFAAAGIGLALVLGVPLALCSSMRVLFEGEPLRRPLQVVFSLVFLLARTLSTLMRSVHELLWAVLFLAAFGLSDFTAVLAIAIPYGGVFARVFADLIDETTPEPGIALQQVGANKLGVFLFATLPLALPNMAAYLLYRFECAVRSSAILGFFGLPTLGYFITNAFENLYYAEVWSYLYTLFLLIILLDVLSHYLRRNIIA